MIKKLKKKWRKWNEKRHWKKTMRTIRSNAAAATNLVPWRRKCVVMQDVVLIGGEKAREDLLTEARLNHHLETKEYGSGRVGSIVTTQATVWELHPQSYIGK